MGRNWEAGDAVSAVRNNNRQRNFSPATVVAVHPQTRRMTESPLGVFKVCLCSICNVLWCGSCELSPAYDVRYADGRVETNLPADRVLPLVPSPPVAGPPGRSVEEAYPPAAATPPDTSPGIAASAEVAEQPPPPLAS